ncbi:MAG TPA: N-6 DNA methylase [Pirellulales bacterium]|nr:N-6 DNA methylase [Pirellulales bacterium]
MTARFFRDDRERLFGALRSHLEGLGYRGDLLAEDYSFPDWFSDGRQERSVPIAAFGQTPLSYETACFSVLPPSHKTGRELVQDFRALGAPFAFEITAVNVQCWGVGAEQDSTTRISQFDLDNIDDVFQKHADDWLPLSVLRAKNVASKASLDQRVLFDFDLIPELEHHIREKLDPLLKRACSAAKRVYNQTSHAALNAHHMFQLAFWLLAGKIFHDRRIDPFVAFDINSNPDEVLAAVADYYGEHLPAMLNRASREAVYKKLWGGVDLRNVSIDVLTHIWANTFVSKDIREALGIHSTPRSVAKFIVDQLPFEAFDTHRRIVVEPCCGSATFLVSAMQRLRELLPSNTDHKARHKYFTSKLLGFEQEAIGVEIARLCLTLADFPNPNHWQIFSGDVFRAQQKALEEKLRNTRIVLCNPPFQSFSTSDPLRASTQSVHKPVEILNRVLDSLHPQGVLGFVLPRKFLDSGWYEQARTRLIDRFASLDLVSLPDTAFRGSNSGVETVLLIATQPRSGGQSSTVRHRRVSRTDWEAFSRTHRVSSDDVCVKTAADAARSLSIPLLRNLWMYLEGFDLLGTVARIRKGIEWNRPLKKYRNELVRHTAEDWTREGVPPLAKIEAFQVPDTMHLSMKPEDRRRNAYSLPWDTPKVIMNGNRRSRGPWRLSAFADFNGLICYRTFLAAWPNDPACTTVLAAILNNPLANAFAYGREGQALSRRDLEKLPVPKLSESLRSDTDKAVAVYLEAVSTHRWEAAEIALRQIDAIILRAYDLPPRLERELLDLFRGEARPLPFKFGDYFPESFTPSVPLWMYVSEEFARCSVQTLRAMPEITEPELIAAFEQME